MKPCLPSSLEVHQNFQTENKKQIHIYIYTQNMLGILVGKRMGKRETCNIKLKQRDRNTMIFSYIKMMQYSALEVTLLHSSVIATPLQNNFLNLSVLSKRYSHQSILCNFQNITLARLTLCLTIVQMILNLGYAQQDFCC